MSNEQSNFYINNPFQDHQYGNNTNDFSFLSNSPTQGFEYPNSSYTRFADCLQGYSSEYNAFETYFGLSSPSSEALLQDKDERELISGSEVPFTPYSSVPSLLSEGGDEGSEKGKKDISQELVDGEEKGKKDISQKLVDGEERFKKENKLKKKSGKKEREPHFAFVTKSEVDQLEDGYRWRKYGQKAVKNSPFPRSYYRCTTKKCLVKKRIERSYQDPTTVITTYEGKHSHPISPIFEGHENRMLAPPPQTSMYDSYYQGGSTMSYFYPQNSPSTLTPPQELHFDDHGIFQEMVPSSMFFKQ